MGVATARRILLMVTGAPHDCETGPATAVAGHTTDTAVSDRGQEQRGGGPHPTAVSPSFVMRPRSQARSHPPSQSRGTPRGNGALATQL